MILGNSYFFFRKKCSIFFFENSQHFHHVFYRGGDFYKIQRDKILKNKLAICVYIIARDMVLTNNGNKVLNSGWNPSIPKSASVCMVIEYFLNEETLCRSHNLTRAPTHAANLNEIQSIFTGSKWVNIKSIILWFFIQPLPIASKNDFRVIV